MKPFRIKKEQRARQPLQILDSRTTLEKPKPPLKFVSNFLNPYPHGMIYLTYDGRHAMANHPTCNFAGPVIPVIHLE